MPLGSSTIPLRGTDSIMWTIKFRDGKTLKRFKFPIRTTAEGSIDCFKGKTLPTAWLASRNPVSSPVRPALSNPTTQRNF